MRGGAPSWRGSGHAALLACVLFAALIFLPMRLAQAIEAISVEPNQEKIDITAKGELYEGRGNQLQIETAPGPDGYVGRMAVAASTPGTNPGWLVFALSNPTSERIVRWLVAPRYTLANSRVFWPELDAGRIAAVTPSLGFRPEPLKSDRADMYRLSLEPGQTITFAAELVSGPRAAAQPMGSGTPIKPNSRTACCSTACCSASPGCSPFSSPPSSPPIIVPSSPRPRSSPGRRCAYFCVDFGFWNKLFPVGPGPHPRSTGRWPKPALPRASCCFSTPSSASDFGMSGSGRCSGLGSRHSSP